MRPVGLPPRALELVVERGILELREVERRRVLHEPDARVIREQIAEQALDQRGRAREQLAAERRSRSRAATSMPERCVAVPMRARAAQRPRSMMSFPIQSARHGTNARATRSTIMISGVRWCVSHTSLTSFGT